MRFSHGNGLREGQGRARLRVAGVPLVSVALIALCLAVLGCGNLLANARESEERGDLNGAVAGYLAALETDPDNLDALSGAAVCLLMLQRHDEALLVQERLVALDTGDVQNRVELGFNYLNHQDRPGDAARVLREATVLEPSAKNLTFLAQAQMASGDSGGAEQTLLQAIGVDPRYAHSYTTLVRLLEAAGRGSEAGQVKAQALQQGITIAESS